MKALKHVSTCRSCRTHLFSEELNGYILTTYFTSLLLCSSPCLQPNPVINNHGMRKAGAGGQLLPQSLKKEIYYGFAPPKFWQKIDEEREIIRHFT